MRIMPRVSRPGRTRFSTKRRRASGEPQRQDFVNDALAHEIGQRHFGRWNEAEPAALMLLNCVTSAACASSGLRRAMSSSDGARTSPLTAQN